MTESLSTDSLQIKVTTGSQKQDILVRGNSLSFLMVSSLVSDVSVLVTSSRRWYLLIISSFYWNVHMESKTTLALINAIRHSRFGHCLSDLIQEEHFLCNYL